MIKKNGIRRTSLRMKRPLSLYFIIINEARLIELHAHELFHAINHLVELGILKRRNCDAVAYEWADRERITGLID